MWKGFHVNEGPGGTKELYQDMVELMPEELLQERRNVPVDLSDSEDDDTHDRDDPSDLHYTLKRSSTLRSLNGGRARKQTLHLDGGGGTINVGELTEDSSDDESQSNIKDGDDEDDEDDDEYNEESEEDNEDGSGGGGRGDRELVVCAPAPSELTIGPHAGGIGPSGADMQVHKGYKLKIKQLGTFQ